jgi:hypothetical protein
MRSFRALFLCAAAVVIYTSSASVKADSLSCNYCHAFANWCAGFCHEHGGTLLCTIHTGGSCSDFCYCADGAMYYDNSGMCPPCDS